jgi:glycosyltransferase involved in cell wall biosynthesis
MQKISAIILTKNEEKNINKTLESLKWCDELIIVDDNSNDKTVKIAEKFSAKIYERSLDSFSAQRNFGISKASGEWILFVDADEIISEPLAFEISNAILSWTDGVANENKGYYLKRNDVIWGKELKYGESGIKLLRLAKNGAGKWEGMVHEKWKIHGKTGVLINPMTHYPHQVISEFLGEINFYTTLRAKELYSKKKKACFSSVILFPSGKFLFNYFFKMGILDGIPGLVHALIMSFHSFLVRGKLWVMWNKE